MKAKTKKKIHAVVKEICDSKNLGRYDVARAASLELDKIGINFDPDNPKSYGFLYEVIDKYI